MPVLTVVRHAQAQSFAARDHERALTPDGVRSARSVGRLIARTGVPDRVVVSSARRARQTLDEAMRAGGWDATVTSSDVLYSGTPVAVLDAVAAAADGRASVLVVGHEPWCSGVVATLTGAHVRMATATLAALEVGPAWDALDPAWCTLTAVVPPWLAVDPADAD